MSIVRVGLVLLALGQGSAALLALFAPRTFYDDFPVAGADWVSSFAPYNEHLIRDYGASFLAIAALALIAARLAERRLMAVALVVWLIAAIPHAIFHLAHSDTPAGFSGIASLATLAVNVLAPLVLLYLVRKEPSPS
jgi:hypothetical protein